MCPLKGHNIRIVIITLYGRPTISLAVNRAIVIYSIPADKEIPHSSIL